MVRLAFSTEQHTRWTEMVELARKDFGVDDNSTAVFRALESYVQGWGRNRG
jgi:hypothetical protein